MMYDRIQPTYREHRPGVTKIMRGNKPSFAATIRKGNHLIFLGSGNLDYCIKLYDEAKAEQEKKKYGVAYG